MLIESNRQRIKTMRETMREAEHIERIIAEEAKRRMLAGTTEDGAGGRGNRKNPPPTLAEGLPSERETRTQVAAAVGMKRSTYNKTKSVYDAATGPDVPEPVAEVARQQMAALDAGDTNPTKAERAVRGAERQAEEQERARFAPLPPRAWG